MAVKLASILVATIAVSISILEGQQFGIQEENSLEYYSNPGQERAIQGNILSNGGSCHPWNNIVYYYLMV